MNKLLLFTVGIFGSISAAFSQNAEYEVYALRFTAPQLIPLSSQILDSPDNEMAKAVYMFWLLKGPNGRNVLVDAAFLSDVDEAKSRKLSGFIRPDSMLLRIGLRAEEITDVILTHPHWDHVDGVDLFVNAKIWIQRDDFNYFVSTAWQPGGINRGFNKRDVRKLIELNLAGKVVLIDGDDKEIYPGIRVYTGSKHTFGSQYVLVQCKTDKIIIASDNVKFYYNVEHMKSVTKTGTFDTDGYITSMVRMKSLVSDIGSIIPGHDATVFERFPNPGKGVAKIR